MLAYFVLLYAVYISLLYHIKTLIVNSDVLNFNLLSTSPRYLFAFKIRVQCNFLPVRTSQVSFQQSGKEVGYLLAGYERIVFKSEISTSVVSYTKWELMERETCLAKMQAQAVQRKHRVLILSTNQSMPFLYFWRTKNLSILNCLTFMILPFNPSFVNKPRLLTQSKHLPNH